MSSTDDSSALARQIQDDERMARELQEKIYDELQSARVAESNARLPPTLQQEENAWPPTTSSRPRSIAHLYRNYSLDSIYNGSTRNSRGTSNASPIPASMRMAQLRRCFQSRSRAVPSDGRRTQSDMRFRILEELEAELDVNEELEAGFEGNTRMGMHGRFLRAEHSFDENDHDMSLPLDNNDDRRGGASVEQINCLPLAVVQDDSIGESCAICLDTLSITDSIRVLMCCHRFHRECIDTWLGRRAVCPICKSSKI